jgi:hypothetical protein
MKHLLFAAGFFCVSVVPSATAAATTPASAVECGGGLPEAARQRVTEQGYTLAYAPSRFPIPVSEHFSLALQLCPDVGKPLPDVLVVDADMPLHRHGMNYRATVKHLGQGRYRADGLMFHMPGRWRVLFDLRVGSSTVRILHTLDVE